MIYRAPLLACLVGLMLHGAASAQTRPSDAANQTQLLPTRFTSKRTWDNTLRRASLRSPEALSSDAGKRAPRNLTQASPVNRSQLGRGPLPGVQLRPWLRTGQVPTAVVTGDFNGDGKQDFVVSNGWDDTLWIYFGRGDGTFEVPRVIPLTSGRSPVSLAAGDLRGIGVLDLVVANSDSYSVSVFLGNGDGTFSQEHPYNLSIAPACLTIADVNHDGKLDIVVAFDDSTQDTVGQPPFQLTTLLGTGSGSFEFGPMQFLRGVEAQPWDIVAADMNGDGLIDLVTTGPNVPEGARLILNKGNGSFEDAENVYLNILLPSNDTGQPTKTALGDVNHDGCLDAVITDMFVNGIDVRFGDCTGHFGPVQQYSMGDTSDAPLLADVNGDGYLDVITVSRQGGGGCCGYGDNAGGNLLSVSLNDGTGKFLPARVYRGTGTSVALAMADFNGDGKPDIVSVSSQTDKATIFINDGSGGFGDPQGLAVDTTNTRRMSNFPTPTFTDLNGDGKADIFFLEQDASRYYLSSAINDGTGRFSAPIVTPSELAWSMDWVADYRLADFRNTGRKDFVATGLFTPYIAFAPNLGNGRFGPTVITTFTNGIGPFAVGDFNRDGFLDIVTKDQVFLGDGKGSFRAGPMTGYSDPLLPGYMFATDLNRDGNLDLLIHSDENGGWTTNDKVWEFFGNGDGTFQAPKQVLDNLFFFSMPDLNHDGIRDILLYPATLEIFNPTPGNNFAIATGRPDGSFSSVTPVPDQYTGISVETLSGLQQGPSDFYSIASDLNGDGNLDLLAVQSYPGARQYVYAQILSGNADGTFTPTYDMIPFNGATFPKFAYDFDGDGKADLLIWSPFNNSFHIMKGTAASALQLELADQPYPGTSGYGVVYLNTAWPTDINVSLSSSIQGVNVPALLTIPSGQLSGGFTFTVDPSFDRSKVIDLRATLGSDTAIDYANMEPVSAFQLGISGSNNQTIAAGDTTDPMTLVVNASEGYSGNITFRCQGLPTYVGQCNFLPSSVTVSSGGSASTTFTLSTSHQVATWGGDLSLIAEDGVNAKTKPFELNIPIIPPGKMAFLGDSMTFNVVVGRQAPSQQIIAISTTAGGPTHINNIAISPADYTQTNDCPYILNPGASCIITVTFAPQSAGVRNGQVTITDDAHGNPHIIPLTGNAVDFSLSVPSAERPRRGTRASMTKQSVFTITLESNGASLAGAESSIVALSCSGLPLGSTCVISPTTVDLRNPRTDVHVTIDTPSRARRLHGVSVIANAPVRLVARSGSVERSVELTSVP